MNIERLTNQEWRNRLDDMIQDENNRWASYLDHLKSLRSILMNRGFLSNVQKQRIQNLYSSVMNG